MWLCSGGRAHSAAEALALLGGGSLRLFQDLRLCVQNGWQPWVFLREWREMAEHAEWRGFLRDRELVGLSQYHVAAVQCNADVQALRNGGAQALVVLGLGCKPHWASTTWFLTPGFGPTAGLN